MPLTRSIKLALLRLPPIRRYVAVKWSMAEALNEAEAALTETKGRLRRAEAERANLGNEVARLRAALDAALQQVEQLTTASNDLRAERDAASGQAEAQRLAATACSGQLQLAESQFEGLRRASDLDKKIAEAALTRAIAENDRLREKLSQLTSSVGIQDREPASAARDHNNRS